MYKVPLAVRRAAVDVDNHYVCKECKTTIGEMKTIILNDGQYTPFLKKSEQFTVNIFVFLHETSQTASVERISAPSSLLRCIFRCFCVKNMRTMKRMRTTTTIILIITTVTRHDTNINQLHKDHNPRISHSQVHLVVTENNPGATGFFPSTYHYRRSSNPIAIVSVATFPISSFTIQKGSGVSLQ